MAIQITQAQYNTTRQTVRNYQVKINLLDFDLNILDSLEGNVISGNVAIDANSDIRRTCQLSLVVTDSSFDVQAGGQIFLDKLFQVYVGVQDFVSGEIAWTNMGVYIINQPSYTYDAENKTLALTGLDLMAKITGLRNGYIGGLAGDDITLLKTGDSVRDNIIAILKECGFTRYLVSECENVDGTIQDIPYDMEFSQGSTWFDVLSALRNILPQYQIYFDVDGVFHYDMIPSSDSDPILIDTELWEANVLNEQVDVDFENVKNAIEVYGVTHDTEYFSDVTVSQVNNNVITLTVDERASLVPFTEVAFVLPRPASGNLQVNVNSWGAKPLKHPNGENVTSLADNVYWVITYREGGYWEFLGHLQAQGYSEDNNPDSPFYVNGSTGKILLPLYGGEYDNIQSDYLAEQRANYEIYLRCRLNDSLRLTTVPIYWADVQWKVRYTPLGTDEPQEYLVQSIHTDLSQTGTQTWSLSKFYSFYPVIV